MSEWVRSYEHGTDCLESLDGIAWPDAPLPPSRHGCKAQTRGWFGMNYVERCACGAVRLSASHPWMERNATRRSRAQAGKSDGFKGRLERVLADLRIRMEP
jgi:hypothetical protein